jgi:hypothetical protein
MRPAGADAAQRIIEKLLHLGQKFSENELPNSADNFVMKSSVVFRSGEGNGGPTAQQTYRTRDEARQDLFDEIEMFRKPRRTHVRSGMLSPAVSGRQHDIQTIQIDRTDPANRIPAGEISDRRDRAEPAKSRVRM